MNTKSQNIENQIDDALEAGDANKLDLALRAQYHFQCRGMSVSTEGHEYDLVKTIDPNFYG